MGEISIREMRGLLAKLEKRLAREGELILTRRGKPVARILPLADRRRAGRPSHAGLRAAIKHLEKESADYVRRDRDER